MQKIILRKLSVAGNVKTLVYRVNHESRMACVAVYSMDRQPVVNMLPYAEIAEEIGSRIIEGWEHCKE